METSDLSLTAEKRAPARAGIVIDEGRCKGCGLCTVACPRGLISMSTVLSRQGFFPARIAAADLEKCTACALCARLCPDVAIAVYRERRDAGAGGG